MSPARTLRRAPQVLLLSTIVAGEAAFLPAPGALRILAVVILFVLGPGVGLVPLLGLHRDRLVAAVAVLSVSISADVITAEAVMTATGLTWQPCALVLLVLTGAGAAVQMMLPRRSW